MIRWNEPGYLVAFTTRAGGVSSGVYESLNLTSTTGDGPQLVAENRRIACTALRFDPEQLVFNRQVHSTKVHRARVAGRGQPGDGLWSDEPHLPLLAMSADCVPIAVARRDGPRALALLHAGWRGIADGIIGVGVAALGAGAKAAMVGPAIGPCCYDVGSEVAARFDSDLVNGRKLDLWSAAERALRMAGVDVVDRADLCTNCHPELFFSHRRSGRARGAQGVLGAIA